MTEGVTATEAASRVGAALGERWALARDRAAVEELAREARPVCGALLEAMPADDPDAPVLREAIAMASLLGRRAGDLGVTPTASLSVIPAVADAVELPRGGALATRLSEVFAEGFVAAREERLEEAHAKRMADGVVAFELAPRCWAIVVGGRQVAAELERVLDEHARKLLDRDARACVVHAALDRPGPDVAAQLFAVDDTCRMLGVACVFSGVGPGLRSAAAERGIDVETLRVEPTPREAIAVALESAGLSVQAPGALSRMLRRLGDR